MSESAAASGTGIEEKNNIWAILPGLDPAVDDPKEYGDKVRFLAKICPKHDKPVLAPRLAIADERDGLGSGERLGVREVDGPEQWSANSFVSHLHMGGGRRTAGL